MGIPCFGASSALLCEEDRNSVLGLGDCDGGGDEELVEVGSGVDFSVAAGAVFDTDEFVRELVEKETDHLPLEGYAERLEHGGLESTWRREAMDWICKHDNPWTKRLLSVACLSIAVKMEETVAPHPEDLQVCDVKPVFDGKIIGRMELLVMKTLNYRMQAVTPFAFLSYFLDKFSEGKPPSFALASQCAEIIVGTLKVLAAVSANQVVGFGSVLSASDIPVNKEMIARCSELMEEWALGEEERTHHWKLFSAQSPIGVLDAACFSFRSEELTIKSSESNTSGNNSNQVSTQATKRRRLSISPI
ncbi:hypothetical protein HU200_004971 [Digitaria exilis]|uniref:Cyclin N-terminal domain-containing protein n=1 Tax=Digitaria exilis TaxID=1010633 RepID=A0A835FRG8_9POAL|nr:hypothetical protein HU200_004971 [Digitaria exilis]